MDSHTDISLDEPELYQRLDPSGLRERIADLPYQCLHAWEEGLRFRLPSSYRKARNVILAGVGGSAIGGELMGDLITRDGSPLVTVCRDYHLPPYLGPDSLVIVSSYSGNTEETIAAFQDAIERKAKGGRGNHRWAPAPDGPEGGRAGIPDRLRGRAADGFGLQLPCAPGNAAKP